MGIIEWHHDRVLFQYYPGTRDTDFVSLLMPVRNQPYFSPLPGVLPPVFEKAELLEYCRANPAFQDAVGTRMLTLWQTGLSASLPTDAH